MNDEFVKSILDLKLRLKGVQIDKDLFLSWQGKVPSLNIDDIDSVVKFVNLFVDECGKDVIKILVYKDKRPPKEWFERVVRRLMENGYSEDEAKRLAGWIYYHWLKPHKPESKKEPDKPSTQRARERKRNYLSKSGPNSKFDERVKKQLERLEDRIKKFDDDLVDIALKLEDIYEEMVEENYEGRGKLRKLIDKLEALRPKVKDEFKDLIREYK